MAVNLSAPDAGSLHAVSGVGLGIAMAGIKKPGRKDLLVMRLAPGSQVAGVFTQNRFCAAPVILAKGHVRKVAWSPAVRTPISDTITYDADIRPVRVMRANLSRYGYYDDGQNLPFSTRFTVGPLQAYRHSVARLNVPVDGSKFTVAVEP